MEYLWVYHSVELGGEWIWSGNVGVHYHTSPPRGWGKGDGDLNQEQPSVTIPG